MSSLYMIWLEHGWQQAYLFLLALFFTAILLLYRRQREKQFGPHIVLAVVVIAGLWLVFVNHDRRDIEKNTIVMEIDAPLHLSGDVAEIEISRSDIQKYPLLEMPLYVEFELLGEGFLGLMRVESLSRPAQSRYPLTLRGPLTRQEGHADNVDYIVLYKCWR